MKQQRNSQIALSSDPVFNNIPFLDMHESRS